MYFIHTGSATQAASGTLQQLLLSKRQTLSQSVQSQSYPSIHFRNHSFVIPSHKMQALPQDVLVLVLRHVDQAERLSSCALVSNAWAEAAVVASDAINIRTDDTDLFMPWLQHHGSHVTKFTCACEGHREDKELFSMLPCSNLLDLTVNGWEVCLKTRYGSGGILRVATGLTKLQLNLENQEDLVSGFPSLTALHALPALQHFDLSVQQAVDEYEPDDADALPSCVISGLTTLTRLELQGVLALESLQPFSCLTKLQHLNLDLDLGVEDTAEAVQSGQQPFKQLQALTHLSMHLLDCKLVSTSSSPAFSGCTALQELHLYRALVDASAFQGLTGLRVLELFVGSVVERAAVSGVAALLRHIASMQQLQRLVLEMDPAGALVALRGGDAELCRGVTASPHLTCMDLTGVLLPRSAWVHLFPPGLRLQQLHGFAVRFNAPSWPFEASHLFDCSALEQLVDCCPAITCLTFPNLSLFKQDVSLVPLLRLQQLAQLEGPYVVDGAVSVGVLARLSSLTSLHLYAVPGLTDVGLLQLTALTGLQELGVMLEDNTGIPSRNHSLSFLEGGHRSNFQATKGRSPHVWYQLLLACASTAECRATLDQQLPGIVQQLQDSGHGTSALELAREVARTRAHEADIEAALKEAKAGVAAAKAQLLQQLRNARQRFGTLELGEGQLSC